MSKQTRAELDKRAERLGIEGAKEMDTRADVIEAIKAVEPDEGVTAIFKDGGAAVVSVFGPFGSQTLVMMPSSTASALFDGAPLAQRGLAEAIDGVERDLKEIAKRKADLASSALAASAKRLAIELEHPFNSATSKAQLAKELRQTMDRLLELAPPDEEEGGALNELVARRAARIATA